MSKFIVNKFKDIKAYVPGEQPKIGEFIKLNTNESPFPPPIINTETLKEKAESLNIYNDTDCKILTESFTKLYGIKNKNVVFGNGSDEILAFCFLAFCERDVGVTYPEITYGFYDSLTTLYGVKRDKIPLNTDFTISIKDYFNKGKTVLIANPNAPTGIALSRDEIEEILISNRDNVVIIDEAYVAFGGETAVPLIEKYDNIVVVGTFSKARNLAGARLGFAIASEELVVDINNIRCSYNPYNVNTLTQFMGQLSIENNDYYNECIEKITATREMFIKGLDKIGFTTLNSKANFVFTKYEKISGEYIYEKLREEKILVRYFSADATKDFVRISIGTQEQMEKVLLALEKIVEEIK